MTSRFHHFLNASPPFALAIGLVLANGCLPERGYEGLTEGTCSDQVDNDEDGAVDCADADCQIQPICEGVSPGGSQACTLSAQEVVGSNGPLDCVAQSDGSTCFVMCEGNESWENANAACQGAGLDGLVSLLTESEDGLVQDMIGGVDQAYWIGLKHPYTQWANGEDVSYENWQPGQPNGTECTYMHMGVWADGGCSSAYPFVCETRAGTSNASQSANGLSMPVGLDDTGGDFAPRSRK